MKHRMRERMWEKQKKTMYKRIENENTVGFTCHKILNLDLHEDCTDTNLLFVSLFLNRPLNFLEALS